MCLCVCVCAPPVCVCGCLHGEMGGGGVCVRVGGIGLKKLSSPFVSTTTVPQAYDRDDDDERP